MADITRRVPGCDDDCEGERGERGERGKRGHRGHDGRGGDDGETGPTGPTCFSSTGPTGPAGGPTGPTGSTGSTGAVGPTGPSAIIPFASGLPNTLVHVLGGIADTGAAIGFGSSLDGVNVSGVTIDLTGSPGLATNMAFSMPRDGTLVQLSAFFSNVVAVVIPLGSTANIVVQLYRSTTPDNIFTPVPGALVTLPFPAGLISIGTFASDTVAIAIPVLNEDRLLLVARLEVTGVDVVTTVTGYVSAGLAIA
jgi:BclB C-terminal domain-containing protein